LPGWTKKGVAKAVPPGQDHAFQGQTWRIYRVPITWHGGCIGWGEPILWPKALAMIQSLTSQPASMLSGLLSGFTAKDRKSDSDKSALLAGANGPKANRTGAGIADKTEGLASDLRLSPRTPDGVPVAVARAFPDFANLALGIVDRASLGTAANGAQAQTENELLTKVTEILGPPLGPGSLSDQVTQAQQAMAAWQASPADPAARDGALAALRGLLTQTSVSLTGLGQLSTRIDQQIAEETRAVQAGLSRLTQANEAVIAAKSAGQDTKSAEAERKQALAALSERVQLNFQDRPDGALVPLAADGSSLPDKLDDISDLSLRSGLTGGRLKALVGMRDGTLPDLMRQARAIAAGLGARINEAASSAPAVKLVGIDTGLGANERLAINGTTSFVAVDAQGQVQSALTIDFNARTRRGLGVPASGTNIATPAQLAKSVSDGLKGVASLTFNDGVFSFESLSDKFKVAIVASDRPNAGRSLVQVTGLGRLVDAPVAEGIATGFQPQDAHGFPAGQTMTLSLEGSNGRSLTAQITVGGRSFQDLIDQINSKDTGLGNAQFLSLDKDGSLAKAYAPDWVSARLLVIDDQTARAGTGRSFGALFALDTPAAPRLADGVNLADLGQGRAVIDDKTRRGSALVRSENTGSITRLVEALGGEVIVPSSLGKPTRMLPLDIAARELATGAAERADAAAQRQSDARAFGLALRDERGRLSSASFGAELAHLAGLQTARNMSGRLDQQSTAMLAHLDRALTRKASHAAQSIAAQMVEPALDMAA